jgi:predicted RNase H-like HicB family nuclease
MRLLKYGESASGGLDWEGYPMKRLSTASVWREGSWFIAQCLEVDVASQGETEEEALANLREALELHSSRRQLPTFPAFARLR